MSRFRMLTLPMSLAMGMCVAIPGIGTAQVTYFKQPPSAEQLRAALLAPAAAPAAEPTAAPAVAIPGSATRLPEGNRTRGIVWNTGSAAGAAAASASAPLPVAAAAVQAPDPAVTAGSQGAPAAALPINFHLGSSRIDHDSLPYIETVASLLRSDPSLRLVIEGHTDDRGSYNRNMVLSWDRALGVFRTLVETYGVEPNRLQPVGKGPLEPMPGTSPSDGANRRVQFRISG